MLTQIIDATTPRKAPSLQNGLSRVSAAIFGVRSPPLSEETPYPLDPLSARELETATAAVKLHAASALAPGTPLRFNIVTLQVCTCFVTSFTPLPDFDSHDDDFPPCLHMSNRHDVRLAYTGGIRILIRFTSIGISAANVCRRVPACNLCTCDIICMV